MDDVLEFLVFLVIVVAVVGGIFTVIFQLGEASSHDDCHSKGELVQADVTYRKWDGCYVNQNGLWMPFDVWQYNRDHGIKMN